MSTRAVHELVRVVEVPIPYQERVGRSKLNVVRDGIRFLETMVWTAMTYNPVRILGLVGLTGIAFAAACRAQPDGPARAGRDDAGTSRRPTPCLPQSCPAPPASACSPSARRSTTSSRCLISGRSDRGCSSSRCSECRSSRYFCPPGLSSTALGLVASVVEPDAVVPRLAHRAAVALPVGERDVDDGRHSAVDLVARDVGASRTQST